MNGTLLNFLILTTNKYLITFKRQNKENLSKNKENENQIKRGKKIRKRGQHRLIKRWNWKFNCEKCIQYFKNSDKAEQFHQRDKIHKGYYKVRTVIKYYSSMFTLFVPSSPILLIRTINWIITDNKALKYKFILV